jgi:hypothetical protein
MPADGELTVALATTGPTPVRLVLSAPQRPWQDVVVDYEVTVTGEGLAAKVVVTSIEGDSLADYFSAVAERFRGWSDVLEWQSLEGQLRAEATWTNRGHVMLRIKLRPTSYDTAWEISAEFDIEAGAEMEALSTKVSDFFRSTR